MVQKELLTLLLEEVKTSDGKIIYFPQDDPDVIISKSLQHIFGGLTPGAVTSATRIWDGATGRFTDYGSQRDMADEVVALMSGVRVEDAKPVSYTHLRAHETDS